MKALGKLEKKKGITLYEAPKPTPGPRELLIKVQMTAICGTDINIYEWKEWAQKTIPVPMTIGHEFVGTIAELGRDVKAFKVGDRVSGEGHLVCGICRNCRAGKRHYCRNTMGVGVNRTGCFAEYLCIPEENAFLVPENIPDEIASIFDPLGNAVHTALSFDLVGEDVLITGAGPIGIMASAVAKHAGARHIVITDINEKRLELAKKMPITRAVNPLNENLSETMQKLGMKEGFDVGLEMSGSASALNDMIDVMNHGGKIALLGILPMNAGIDWTKVVFNSLFIKGIYGREMFETWYKMTSMLQSGLNIMPVITHRFSCDQYEEAFETMSEGKCGKIVLDWAPAKKRLSDIQKSPALQPLSPARR